MIRTNTVQHVLKNTHVKAFLESLGESFSPAATFMLLGNSNIVRDNEFYFVASVDSPGATFNRFNKRVYQFSTAELVAYLVGQGGTVPANAVFYIKPIAWNPNTLEITENIIVIALDNLVDRL